MEKGDIIICKEGYVNHKNRTIEFVKNSKYYVEHGKYKMYDDYNNISIRGDAYVTSTSKVLPHNLLSITYKEFDKYFETMHDRRLRLITHIQNK